MIIRHTDLRMIEVEKVNYITSPISKKQFFFSVLDPFEGSKAILQELSTNDSDYMFEYTGVSGDQFKRFVLNIIIHFYTK